MKNKLEKLTASQEEAQYGPDDDRSVTDQGDEQEGRQCWSLHHVTKWEHHARMHHALTQSDPPVPVSGLAACWPMKMRLSRQTLQAEGKYSRQVLCEAI